jgi:hypothetical protein
MWDRGLLFAVAALAGVVLTNTAEAQQAMPPIGAKVKIAGCLNKNVDNFCTIVHDGRTGQPYAIQIYTAQPPIAPFAVDHIVFGTGTVASYYMFCGPVMPVVADFHYSILVGHRCLKK